MFLNGKKKINNKKSLYFAYGSNLLIERLQNRVSCFGTVTVVKTFVLNNYNLVFNVKGGYANIIPLNGSIVEGVLYELNETQIEELDKYEGCYRRVYFKQGNDRFISYICHPYFVEDKLTIPSLLYLNIIIDGAMANKLKFTYNKLVKFKNDYFKLKKSKHGLWM